MKLYFRHHDQGARVFRMEVANRQRRIQLDQIASITEQGDVAPYDDRPMTDAELAEIKAEWATWRQRRDAGELKSTETFMAELNRFTDWIASDAAGVEVNGLSDELLLALLDLRQTVVRRLSDIESTGAQTCS